MPRVALDLNKAEDRQKVKGQWRFAPGLVPGEPNEGLKAQLLGSPARLADYDDSKWEVCNNIRQSPSVGFTFGWYRITVEIPAQIDGVQLAGSRVFFKRKVANNVREWINAKLNRPTGVTVALKPRRPMKSAKVRVPGRNVATPAWLGT